MGMESKLIFLGTGGDSVVVGKYRRSAGGIVLQTSGLQFHIDPGPGSLAELAKNNINVRETSCILLSHLHTNHSNDVRAVTEAMTLGGLDKKGVLVCNEASFMGYKGATPVLDAFHKGCFEKNIIMKPGDKLGVGDVEITALSAKHSVPTIGFKISTEHFTMAYSGDTEYSERLGLLYKGADLLVLNVVAPFGYELEGHLSSDDAVKIIQRAKPKVAVITHFGVKMIDQDPMYQAREIYKKTGISIIAAEDGMVISPRSYSVSKSQKRLSSFH